MAAKAIKLSDGTNTLLPVTNAKLVQVNNNECLENRLVGIIDLVSYTRTGTDDAYVYTLTCTGNFSNIVDGQIFLIRFNNVTISPSWSITGSGNTNRFVITLSNNTTITKTFVAAQSQISTASEWYRAKYAFIIYNGTNDRFEPASMNYPDENSTNYVVYDNGMGPDHNSEGIHYITGKRSDSSTNYLNVDYDMALGYLYVGVDNNEHEIDTNRSYIYYLYVGVDNNEHEIDTNRSYIYIRNSYSNNIYTEDIHIRNSYSNNIYTEDIHISDTIYCSNNIEANKIDSNYVDVNNLTVNNVYLSPLDMTAEFVTQFDSNVDSTGWISSSKFDKLYALITSGCSNMIYIIQSYSTKTWCYGCEYDGSYYYLYFIDFDEFLKFKISKYKSGNKYEVQRIKGSYKVTKNLLVDNSNATQSREGQEFAIHFNYSKYVTDGSEGFASPVGFNNKIRFIPYTYTLAFYENDEITNAFSLSRSAGMTTYNNSYLMTTSKSISNRPASTAYMWDPRGGITYMKSTNYVEENNNDLITSGAVFDAISNNELVVSAAINDLNVRIMQLEAENINLMNRVSLLEEAMEAYIISYMSV